MQRRITVVVADGHDTFVTIELNGKQYTVRPDRDGILVLCNEGIEATPSIIVNDVPRCIAIK